MDKDFKIAECVQCGYCCTKGVCAFGQWDEENKKCQYLTKENLCEKYNEIILKKEQVFSPAFGYGCCCSLFNTRREEKIKQLLQDR